MAVEYSLIKPVMDVLKNVYSTLAQKSLTKNAEENIDLAIKELLLANPDTDEVEAQIRIAKAAGLLNKNLFLAENMLKKVKQSRKPKTRSIKKVAKKKVAKKVAKKKVAKKIAKKKVAKKIAKKKVAR